MNIFRTRLTAIQPSLRGCVLYLQRLLMKFAVAVSFQLCLFAARVLLDTSKADKDRAGQSA
ncbi:hypothetical protein BH23CYA1_BH23CYA1_11140 [soil metagenome]|uniref:hypothetical protein n=1 Tax=Leptolyngbya sp. BC1307 TaxID=2029589 RepID=UPI000EFCFC1B|nr:hypothetical protein [Leptolyngbya sp. BC1307]